MISPKVQKLWDDWELRFIMILSLSLQMFLLIFAHRRRSSKRTWFITLVGIAHHLADWIAAYGVGLISRSQEGKSLVANELLAFWSPFFLLHLSGAGSHATLSRDDDHSWLKHLVTLVAHSVAILFIFLKFSPNSWKLWVATLLVFLFAIVRNLQRARSLFLRSHDVLKGSSGSSLSDKDIKLSAANAERRKANLPVEVQPSRPLRSFNALRRKLMAFQTYTHFSTWRYGGLFHDAFKGFIGKVTFNSDHCFFSTMFFLNIEVSSAFKLLEAEVYHMYKALFTQYENYPHNDPYHILLWVFYMFTINPACVVYVIAEKHGFHEFDITLTFILLLGVILQELIAMTSDAPSRMGSHSACQLNLLAWSLSFSNRSWLGIMADKFAALLRLKDVLDILRLKLFVDVGDVTKEVKEIIFYELQKRSKVAETKETAMEICSQRGDWALMRSSLYNQLKWSLGDLGYGESILLWHTATELCYSGKEFSGEGVEQRSRSICKFLSDYTFYLLGMKSEMMASVAGNWETAFYDTVADSRGFFELFLNQSPRNQGEACEYILSHYGVMNQRMSIGGSKSVLDAASKVTKELQKLPRDQQWKLMSEVWVELLTYAAFHCEPHIHAQQIGEGGELLTFVWLLMNHLGLGKQIFEQDNGQDSQSSVVPFSAEAFNCSVCFNPSDRELAISLEFLSCTTSNEILPVRKICDVVMPRLLHYISKGDNLARRFDDNGDILQLLSKIKSDIEAAKKNFDQLKQWEETLNGRVKQLLDYDWNLENKISNPRANEAENITSQTKSLLETLGEIDIVIKELREHLEPPCKVTQIKQYTDHGQSSSSNLTIAEEISSENARVDFQTCYNNLSPDVKKCLLCFSIFPAGSEIRKKTLTYLWIGEEFVDPLAAEDLAAQYFAVLLANGFIEPVNQKDSGDFSSCKMNQYVHSDVLKLGQDSNFADFDAGGKPTLNYVSSGRACLTRVGDGFSEQLLEYVENHEREKLFTYISQLVEENWSELKRFPCLFKGVLNLEKLFTLFNLDETFLMLPPRGFSMMRKLTTVCMGSWQSSNRTYVHFDDAHSVINLDDLKLLRCLSLRRVRGIKELKWSSGEHPELRILDLKACSDLQALPHLIGKFQKLTHLDFSHCFLIDYMPKGISELSELLVLKGFGVSGDENFTDQCTLADLVKLRKLRKLSLYSTREVTGDEGQLMSLSDFEVLQVLSISWTRPRSRALHCNPACLQCLPIRQPQTPDRTVPTSLPASLEKLDLRGWPLEEMPRWVNPSQLLNLKKLYIRGGDLQFLQQQTYASVRVIRLQYLKNLNTPRQTFDQLFPNLVYLCTHDCPMLDGFPADGEFQVRNTQTNGAWETPDLGVQQS